MIKSVISLTFSLFLIRSAIAETPAPPSPASCSDELLTFTACLPYVSVSPNNLTDSPPNQCCDDVSAAFSTGSAVCLCYFLLKPGILGFPLDRMKLVSLTSLCTANDRGSRANFSVETSCSEAVVLPPLQSITGPGGKSNPQKPGAGSSTNRSPPSPSLPPQPAADEDELSTPPNLSATPILSTSTKFGINYFDFVFITSPVVVFFIFYTSLFIMHF